MKPPEATLAGLAAFPDALTDREMTRAHRWFRFCAGARATCVEKLLKKKNVQGYRIKCRRPMNSCLKL